MAVAHNTRMSLKQVLWGGLFIVASCKKAAVDPKPLTPEQLLVGTWQTQRYVRTETASDGRIVRQDSTLYSAQNPGASVFFNADGTLPSPSPSIVATYRFDPPFLTYFYNSQPIGAATTNKVLQLTAQKLVIEATTPTTTSTITETRSYNR